MAQTLDHNKAVTSVTPVIVPTFDEDMVIIQKLDDEPNDVGGLTAAELKAEFDRGGEQTKKYINEQLVPTIIADELTEEARALAESERVANEIERVGNETTRLETEAARVQAEQGRASAEAERKAAEAARAEAEQQRVDSTNGIVAQTRALTEAAAASALTATNAATSASQDAQTALGAQTGASQSASAASGSAGTAQTASTAAQNAATNSQSWAVGGTGTRQGEDTNNAQYWADQAQKAAGGGVLTFNGRAGAVQPQGGDYDASMVGADASGTASAAVSTHNASNTAHSDIRQLITEAGTAIGNVFTKEETLSSATATSLGLDPATATPDGAFGKLANTEKNEHLLGLWPAFYKMSNAGTNIPSSYFRSCAFGNGRHVAVTSISGTNYARYSEDGGETWTSVTVPMTVQSKEMVYGNGIFLVINASGTGIFSRDGGETWTEFTFPVTYVTALSFANGLFIVFSTANTVLTSADCVTWTTHTATVTGSTTSLTNVGRFTYGKGVYVAVSKSSGYIYYSTDLTNWTAYQTNSTHQIYDVIFAGERFVAVGYNSSASYVYYSEDGITWRWNTCAISRANLVIYVEGTYIAFGDSSGLTVSVSNDLVTWKKIYTPKQIHSAAYGNGVVLCECNDYTPIKSITEFPTSAYVNIMNRLEALETAVASA